MPTGALPSDGGDQATGGCLTAGQKRGTRVEGAALKVCAGTKKAPELMHNGETGEKRGRI